MLRYVHSSARGQGQDSRQADLGRDKSAIRHDAFLRCRHQGKLRQLIKQRRRCVDQECIQAYAVIVIENQFGQCQDIFGNQAAHPGMMLYAGYRFVAGSIGHWLYVQSQILVTECQLYMEHNKVCCILEVDVVLWIPEERSTSWCVSKTPYFTSTKIMLGTCVVRRVRTSICTYLRKETKSGRNES